MNPVPPLGGGGGFMGRRGFQGAEGAVFYFSICSITACVTPVLEKPPS